MKLRLFMPLAALACSQMLHAQSTPVTDWHTFKASTATTLAGQGTSSPTVGSAAAAASSAFLVGYFPGITLTNVGDRITFSYQVSFTDGAGFSTAGDQFRFGFYDLNGQTPVTADNTATAGVNGQTDNWRGYWFGHKGGGGAGANGSMRERPAALTGTDNPFSNTGTDPAPSLGTLGGTAVTLVSSTDPAGGAVFSGSMALERTPSGIALAGFLAGNGGTNIFQANDNAEPFPNTYGAVAYLFGNAMSVDQVNLQNVTVSYAVSNALQITSQPADVSISPGQAAHFSVSWTGSGVIPTIQWRENGVDIAGATNAVYSIPSATLGQSGNSYSVVIGNVFGDSVTSSGATLTVIPDTTLPVVTSASSLVANVINVVFSESVDPVTAQDSGSYSLAGNSIAERTLVSSNNVALLLDFPITDSNYTLNIQNVQDLSGNAVVATNVPGTAHGFQGTARVNITNANGVGLAFAVDHKIKVQATGADIFGTKDEFEYAFKTYSGDFDVAVRVESLLNTDANAKAGLMARANSADLIFPDSRNVMIAATPARFLFQYRTNEFSLSTAVSSPRPPTAYPNSWVRLQRSGSVITGYTSTNLSQWTLVSSLDTAESADGPYPTDILVGLAVTSHNVNNATEAVFTQFGNFVELPLLSIARTGNNVDLQWPASATGFVLQRASSLTSPIVWDDVSGSESTSQMSIAVENGPVFFRLRK